MVAAASVVDAVITPTVVSADEVVGLRNPASIRPGQHVLEPLGAYMLLAAKMSEDPIRYSSAFNFGPHPDDMLTVEDLTKIFIEVYGTGDHKNTSNAEAVHEAKLLLLDSSKAKRLIGWEPQMDARQSIKWAAKWYADSEHSAHEKCMMQIKEYFGAI